MGPDGGTPEDVYVADGYVPTDGDSVSTDTIGIQEPSDGGEGPGDAGGGDGGGGKGGGGGGIATAIIA